ncbi:ATP-binding protein [Oceanobacillus jeddahense]|uniref:ATP-binding protein n=1 Tax=Oceanobacillus jeddahense TaxID=1462527 RepID=UPI000AC15A5E|nr:ATP-binding protein [Oceanobacillus jeddahense]
MKKRLKKKVMKQLAVKTERMQETNVKEKPTKLEIMRGPQKGQNIIANYGCKCENIKLNQAKERSKQLRKAKMMQVFDYYSLINDNLQTATIENYEPTNEALKQAKQQVIDYIAEYDGKKNLLLTGSYGTGKSHISVAVTKKMMEQGKECLFLSLPKLLTKIKETFSGNGVTEDELLQMIKRVDLLVLDDISAEHHTEWANTKLFEVLDDRSGKSTIYTTNLNSKELRAQINERNFSRMMENTDVIKMDGRDYRRKDF